uniref:NADH-ubiquinone oxidoreductase chain 6 n=1 Tax=Eurypharynx pelecanoides TaxID=55117 RepID=Q76MN7_EURPE|nr:NADH dehydrogenase subunit 6 [Eurypharynx pelecanoides]
MNFFIFFSLMLLVLGVLGVASNPSPYFAALGLVLAAAGGCGVVAGHGGSFISLVLFLIYLGGMLVVFAYSVALAAEPFPEAWGGWSVMGRMMTYTFLCGVFFLMFYTGNFHYYGIADEYQYFSVLCGDLIGVSWMYYWGWLLIICGWGLLLTLFVILELVRSCGSGSLRTI